MCARDAPRWKWINGRLMVSIDGAATYTPACSLPHNYFANRIRFLWGWPDATEQIFPLATYGRRGCVGPAVSPYRQGHDATQGFFHYSRKGDVYFSLASEAPHAADTGLSTAEPYSADEEDDFEDDSQSGHNGGASDWGDGVLVRSSSQTAVVFPPSATAERISSYRLSIYKAGLALPRDELTYRFPWLKGPAVEFGVSRLHLLGDFRIEALPPSRAVGMQRLRVDLARPVSTFVPPAATCVRSLIVPTEGVRDDQSEYAVRVPFLRRIADISPLGAQFELTRQPTSQNGVSDCIALTKALISATGSYGFIDNAAPKEMLAPGTPDGPALLVSVSELNLPQLPLLALLGAMSLLRLLIRAREPRWMDRTTLIVLALVDILLVMRIVAAFQEFVVSPVVRGSVASAIATAMLVPLIAEFVACPMRTSGRNAYLFVLGFGFVCCSLVIHWYRGAIAASSVEFYAPAALAVICLLIICVSCLLGRLRVPTPNLTKSPSRMAGIVARLEPWMWALPVTHFALVLGGMRERLFFGIGVSALFVPLYVLAFSVWTERFLNGPRLQSFLRLICFGLIAPAGTFMAAHDTGSVIYIGGMALLLVFLPPRGSGRPAPLVAAALAAVIFIGVALGVYSALFWYMGVNIFAAGLNDSSIECLLLAALFAALLIIYSSKPAKLISNSTMSVRSEPWLRFAAQLVGFVPLLILLFSLFGALKGPSEPCFDNNIEQLAACLSKNDLQTNQLRLSRIFAPVRGTVEYSREALGMNAVFDEMRWLSSDAWGGSNGRGFLTVPPRQGLDAYDGAPAIHIIGPFGRSSAAALLLWFVIAVMTAYAAANERLFDFRGLLRLSAVTVFAFVSGYMILANLELVPFTGRNIYLLAARSQTDLLEALWLVLLAVSAPHASRAEAES
jgi:hypothetical protein